MTQKMSTMPEQTHESGFTLIEVLIAMVIFSIGVLAVASMQTNALLGNTKGLSQTEATSWATSQVEQLMSLPFTDPLLRSATSHGPVTPDPENQYQIDWSVVDTPNPNPVLKTVTVNVSWTDRAGGHSHSFQFVKSAGFSN